MQTYRILISDFDRDLESVDVTWVGRRFRWEDTNLTQANMVNPYLEALACNTKKPPATCLALAVAYAYPDASIEIMTPQDVAKADALPSTDG